MTNTSGSVLCCSRNHLPPSHYFIVALPFFEDFDRSDRCDSTAISIVYSFKPDPVGFEARRPAEDPVFLQACCKYNFSSI